MPEPRRHLLLVEDNIDQRELTLRAFRKKDPAVQITTAENGTTSLEILRQRRFDAVILDYSLPQMNGLEVLAQIQQRGYAVPVIMVTGQGDEKIAVEAMKRGAYDYMIKTQNYQATLPITVERVIEKFQLKRQKEEAALRAHRLYELSLSITKERRVDLLIAALVNGVRELVDAEGALLLLVDAENGNILQTMSSGIELDQTALQGPISTAGFFGLAFAEKGPVFVQDPEHHPVKEQTPPHQPPLHQFLSLPLLFQEKILGVLTVVNKKEKGVFSQEDIDILSTLALHSAVAIENARFLEEAERKAITDSLTGLYNHREFQKRLMEEVDRGNRYGKEFSLLMLDIDHFKIFNDTHGHPVGDAILKEVVKLVESSIRNVDIPSRYGGEEFSVILPETPGERAKMVAERIRRSVDTHSFVTPSGHETHLSVSIGVASFPVDANEREELIIAADEALYFAKQGGRNQVCRYSETLKSVIERDNEKLTALLLDPQIKTIKDLASTIDAKSPYTRGHTDGVVEYAIRLADALNLSEEQKKSLKIASLLHNIGMVSVPDTLLNKPGPLSDEEKKIIQAHPGLAQMLIKGSERLEAVLPAILYHHERYDGQGYPNGLKGEDIPFLARVLGVVEAYHAMISVRPYRPKMTKQQAIDELRKNKGTQFDPQVVETFVDLLKSQG